MDLRQRIFFMHMDAIFILIILGSKRRREDLLRLNISREKENRNSSSICPENVKFYKNSFLFKCLRNFKCLFLNLSVCVLFVSRFSKD